jgi:hypothetical protein
LWDVPLAQAFRAELVDALSAMKGAPWVRLVILRQHPPQSDEVQEIKRPLMSDPALGECERAAMVAPSSLTAMQVRRLFTEGGTPNVRFFADERAARAWLRGASLFAKSGGDERAGYRIHANPLSRVAWLEFWGLWDVPLTLAWRDDLTRAYDEMGRAPWVAFGNSSRHPPQSDEVQEIKKELMARAEQVVARNAVILANNAVGKMQVRRLFQESGYSHRFFTDDLEARRWLFESEVFTARGGDERVGFTVHPNAPARLLTSSYWGLFSPSIADELRVEAMRAYDEMDGAPYAMLVDARRCPPQSGEVEGAHRETIAVGLRRGLARIAVVTAEGAQAQTHARRLFAEAAAPPHLRFFADEAEARAWLADLPRS